MVGIKKDAKLEDIDLTPIKDADGLLCVVRFFENEDVPHPYNKIDGLADLRIIETELILLDLQAAQKRIERIEREVHKGQKDNIKELEVLKVCEENLSKERPLREISFNVDEEKIIRGFQFLSKKPLVIAANIGENDIKNGAPEEFKSYCKKSGLNYLDLCAKVESEIIQIDDSELKSSFLADLGITELAREKLIAVSLATLKEVTFFTTKGDETKAWLIKKGASAYEAAGKIHSDIQKGFIKAEVINFQDFINCGSSLHEARTHGKLKLEGKDYVVNDGDIIDFRFNI
jgi:GTP-binding protein YchF